MSLDSYLKNLANHAVVRNSEKESISRSVATLSNRLNSHFDDLLTESGLEGHFVFGSYTRGTNLPRSMDAKSDIDYMIVFKDSSSRPQTYIDRLRRFTTRYYSRSEIKQANPTVVLNLNHISFDLVPATRTFFLNDLQIPAKANDYQDWISTNPNDFNEKLTSKNSNNNNLIKPLARLAKYWNAKNNYPFDSFDLETKIVDHGFYDLSFFGYPQSHWKLFCSFMDNLNIAWDAPNWKKEKIKRLHNLISIVKRANEAGNLMQAEAYLKKLLPPPQTFKVSTRF